MATTTSRIPLIYGGGGLGSLGTLCKVTDVATAQSIFDEFCKNGPMVIDTSRRYGQGTSELIIGQMDLHGSKVDTKAHPASPGFHSPEKLKELFKQSVAALNGKKIRVFYLHAPDRTVPYVDTLRAVNDIYKDGGFEYFGLSNFRTYEVAEMVMIARQHGWVEPTVYEGVYNPIDRTIETEMIPCLRHFNMRLAAFWPSAAGLLIGHLLNPKSLQNPDPGSHFDPNVPFGNYFQERYGKHIGTVSELKAAVEKHGLTLSQASVRWMQHHSLMKPSDLGIIYGGSKVSHMTPIIQYSTEGPLPEPVVQAFDSAYAKIKGALPNYPQDPSWYDPKIHGY